MCYIFRTGNGYPLGERWQGHIFVNLCHGVTQHDCNQGYSPAQDGAVIVSGIAPLSRLHQHTTAEVPRSWTDVLSFHK